MSSHESTELPEIISRWDYGWKALLRYDQYISATNAKAAFILALEGVVLTLVFNWLSISPDANNLSLKCWWPVLSAIITISVFVTVLITLMVVSPNLFSPKSKSLPESIVFFGSVAQQERNEYLILVKNIKPEKMIEDLLIQVHTLAFLLSEKFKFMRRAFRILIYVQMPLFLLMTAIKMLTK